MNRKQGWRAIITFAIMVTVASTALMLAPWARSAIMVDRQLAARTGFQSISSFIEPVAPGDTIADREFGQPDFFHNSSNFVDSQSLSLNTGVFDGVAVDLSSIPNRVYVVDSSNNRVLGWPSVAALTNGQAATLVIGQPDFFSNLANNGGVTAASLNSPAGVAVDSSGNVYIADSSNNRVLEYNSPFAPDGTPGSGDTIADEVFGQGDNFTSSSCDLGTSSPNAATLCSPQGVGVDPMGNLYIADTGNNRVLAYLLPSINTTANVVYGQPDFVSNVSNNGGINSTSLSGPSGVTTDAAGNLYVADHSNSRVLEYIGPLHNRTANRVFGQISFNLNSCNGSGENANSLCLPSGIQFDGFGRLYIVDQQNSRVLEFNSPSFSTTANRVYGQTSLTATGGCNNGNFSMPSATTLCTPSGVALDAIGSLYVVDTNNNRVLKYSSSSVTAAIVLGQPDFTQKTANEVDASVQSNPNAVAFDNSVNGPRLYVADTNNNRVLGYSSPSALANGAPATVVIGQSNFFSNSANQPTSTVSAAGLSGPQGVAVDKSGNLYVADTNNNRVLQYLAPITTGKAAHLVIGQTNFSNNGCNNFSTVGQATLCTPVGVGVDTSGNLYVSDNGNNRVLKYVPTLVTGTKAQAVLGQPSFLTNDANHGGISSTSLSFPLGLGINAGFLYVADRNNNRVLGYALPVSTGAAAHQLFGQGFSFSTNTCNGTGLGTTNLCLPTGVVPTSVGDLFIADWDNNRILEYTHPLSNGQAANLVFGQGGLFTGTNANLGGGPNAEGLNRPLSVTLDGAGNLYAADTSNNRTLQYLAPLAKPSPTPIPKPANASPGTLSFNKVPKGTTSAAQKVTLTNTATTAIVVNAVTVLGTNHIDFAQSNSCVGSLAGLASCTIIVSFTPTAAGGTAETATLTIYDTASNSSQKVNLTGTSLEPVTLSASSLPFGSVTVGVKSAAKSVTVTNNLSTTLSISKVAIGGTNPGDFALAGNTCGASILALKNCTISVTFRPTLKGARSAVLTITDSPDVDSPHNVSLTGTGM